MASNTEYCRLCLVNDLDKIDILNPNHEEGRVQRMIKVLFSLEVMIRKWL